MAILVFCHNCNQYFSRKHSECRRCKSSLSKSQKFRVNLAMPDGSRITRVVEGNLTLARRVEAKMKTEVSELKHLGLRKAPLISEVWDKYIRWAQKNKKSWKDDVSRWKWHVERHVEGKRMDQMMAKDVQAILDKMVKYRSGFFKKADNADGENVIEHVKRDETGNHAPATVKQVLVLVKRFYNWAIQQELYFGHNPAGNVRAPKIDNEKTECLDKPQIHTLFTALERWSNRRAALLVKFAIYTGLRQDEIIGLEWKEVDLEKGLVRLIDPKGKSTTLPISNEGVGILREAKDLLPVPDCPYAFPNREGHKRVNFYKIWSRIRKEAGIPKGFRFHDLRHTFASHLASSGEVDIYTLQKLLNHQTPQMTQRYAHLLDEALRRGANVADKVFSNVNGNNPDSSDII